jgi:hypothetical protein
MRFSTLTLVTVHAMLATATPLAKRKLVTEYKTKCVTDFVYPDGSPARGHHSEPTEMPEVYYHAEEKQADPEPQPNYQPVAVQAEAPSSGSYSDPGDDFVGNCLYQHNIHRHNHSAPDVTWSESLASAAQQLANTCNYGHDTDIGSYPGGYGQNIAMYAATNNLGSEVEFIRTSITEYWYNGEIDLYPNAYGSEPGMGGFHEWGHYTQIVWKGTKEVGCAVAYCDSGLASYPGYYSVCNYGPPGNYGGEYGENVGAPLGEATVNAGGAAAGGY